MLKDLDLDLLERSPEQALQPLRPRDLLSVRKVGFAEPVVVRPLPSLSGATRYQILRGERWWCIAGLLGYPKVPAVVRDDLADSDAAAIATSEDEGSEDPITEARALHALLKTERLSITRLARDLGRTRTALSHLLRLLKLTPIVQSMVQAGKISPGVARALITLPASVQIELAEHAVAKGLSARQVERRARDLRGADSVKTTGQSAPTKDPDIALLESELSALVGCRVELANGRLSIQYDNLEILEGVLERLGYSPDSTWS